MEEGDLIEEDLNEKYETLSFNVHPDHCLEGKESERFDHDSL